MKHLDEVTRDSQELLEGSDAGSESDASTSDRSESSNISAQVAQEINKKQKGFCGRNVAPYGGLFAVGGLSSTMVLIAILMLAIGEQQSEPGGQLATLYYITDRSPASLAHMNDQIAKIGFGSRALQTCIRLLTASAPPHVS